MTGKILVENILNKRYGKLVVLDGERKQYRKNGKTQLYLRCKCDCGNIKVIQYNSLQSGNTNSCGCLQKEITSKNSKKRNVYRIENNYAFVFFTKEKFFIIDAEDVNIIKDNYWSPLSNGYIATNINGKTVLLHRYLLGFNKSSPRLDHEDKNILNNSKRNLRVATNQENVRNSKVRKNNTSGVTGVTWFSRDCRWHSFIFVDKKNIHLGYYNDFKSAVKERLKAEKKYFKEFSPQKHLFEEYGVI